MLGWIMICIDLIGIDRRKITTASCNILERLARWDAQVAQASDSDDVGTVAIAKHLYKSYVRVVEPLQDQWGQILKVLAVDAQSATIAPSLWSALVVAQRGIARLEWTLGKLPGQAVRPAVQDLLLELAPANSASFPVVLVADDSEIAEAELIGLPITLAQSPLGWPRMAHGLARFLWPDPGAPDARENTMLDQWDEIALNWLGPAYAFALMDCALHQPNTSADKDIWARLSSIRTVLSRDALWLPEMQEFFLDLQSVNGWQSGEDLQRVTDDNELSLTRNSPISFDGVGAAGGELITAKELAAGNMPKSRAFEFADLAIAEAVAERLQNGILASSRALLASHEARRLQDKLLDDAAPAPETVYQILEGLREEPLTSGQILTGAWLQRERARRKWLELALQAADPVAAYGSQLFFLDALVLKSLETAAVHRVLVR
ncbi:MAG: hypothetical protein HY692_01145 [Cyanobacteria bacterium NC_groundwater_1444_Ag_S-0.65um_54_12]|nr:hypothetical protein [Cyanobacteria bacterium NC_groundwater_1444_Ag_S-0.65um_54_12]